MDHVPWSISYLLIRAFPVPSPDDPGSALRAPGTSHPASIPVMLPYANAPAECLRVSLSVPGHAGSGCSLDYWLQLLAR